MAGRNAVIHHFEANLPGYRGWEWNAVLACAPGSRHITVNEVVLVSGNDALRAPRWVPYAERVRPGDLGPTDVMPPREDDSRLIDAQSPAAPADRPDGTKKVLTDEGLKAAQQRWRNGNYGPTSEYAEHSQLHCKACAFWLPAGRAIGENFGICTNAYSADGRLVHAAYGCGAHSDTPPAETLGAPATEYFDDEAAIEVRD